MQRILLAPGIFSAVQIAMNRLFNRTRVSGSAPPDSVLSAASARWAASSLAASGSLRVDAAGLSGFDSLIICSRVPKAPPRARTGLSSPAVFPGVRAAVTERVTRRRYGPVGKNCAWLE